MIDFYVYSHVTADTGELFYIGKGTAQRAWSKLNRNQYWKNIVNKHGYKIDIIAENLSEDEALKLEFELVKSNKDAGFCKANLTLGGGGISGLKHTAESKMKISNRSRGSNNPRFGVKVVHSEKTIAKMRGKNHPHSKVVVDTSSGIRYASAGEASRALNIKYPTIIGWLNGKRKNKSSLMYLGENCA